MSLRTDLYDDIFLRGQMSPTTAALRPDVSDVDISEDDISEDRTDLADRRLCRVSSQL